MVYASVWVRNTMGDNLLQSDKENGMRFRVYYRRQFDEKSPAKPDYENDYERGVDVEAASWVNAVEVLGKDGDEKQRKGSRLRRPLFIGDVLVSDAMEAKILTGQRIWASVSFPKDLTSQDFEDRGR